jgi:tigrfam_recA: protein RecA
MEKIEKSFGKGSIMKMGDDSVEQVEVIPTGSIALNVALGVGGYPRGRIIEIYGPESSGKTTLAIHAIAEAQKPVVSLLLLMPNTLSTVSTHLNWELTLTICIFPNRITESRLWKLQNN